MRVWTKWIETSDSGGEAVASVVEDAATEFVHELEARYVKVLSVQGMSMAAHYSMPIEGSIRDDYYTDHGVLIMVLGEE